MDQIPPAPKVVRQQTLPTVYGTLTLVVETTSEAQAEAVLVLCSAALQRTIHHFLSPTIADDDIAR